MDTIPSSSADLPPASSEIDMPPPPPSVPPAPIPNPVGHPPAAQAAPSDTPSTQDATPKAGGSSTTGTPDTATPKKKRSCLGCIGRTLVAGILFLLLLAALAPYLIPTDHLRRMIASTIAEHTGRPTTLASLEINLYAGGIVVRGLEIGGRTPGTPPLCRIERAVLSLDWSSLPRLLDGKPARIETIRVEDGDFFLHRKADGTLNIDDLLAPDDPTNAHASSAASSSGSPSVSLPLLPAVPERIVLQNLRIRFLDDVTDHDTRISLQRLTLKTEDLNAGIDLDGEIALQDLRTQNPLGTLALAGTIDLFDAYSLHDPDATLTLTLADVVLPNLLGLTMPPEEIPLTAGRADGTLRVTLGKGTLHTAGDLKARNLTALLPDRDDPVTFPPLGITFAVRPDAASEILHVESLTVTSPLGEVTLTGSLQPATQPEGTFPVDATGTVNARLEMETIHAFVKENKLALLPTYMGGTLTLEGTATMDASDLRLVLTLQDSPLRVHAPSLRAPLPLQVGASMAYAYRDDALAVETLHIRGDAAHMEASLRATGLWRDARSLTMTLQGGADLPALLDTAVLPPSMEGMTLEGKSALQLNAQTDDTGTIRVRASLTTPEGHPVTLHTPEPIRESIAFGRLQANLDASFRPGPHPDDNRLTVHALDVAAIPFAARIAGYVDPMTGALSLGYVCRFHPTRARALLEKTVPYDLGDWVRELTLQGQVSHTPDTGMLRFANASATGMIDLQGAPYAFALFHDGHVHPQKGHFKTDKFMLTLMEDARTVFSAAVSVHARGPWSAPLGEADFDLNGDLRPLYEIGTRFLPLPHTIRPYAGMTMRGRLVHNEEGIQGEWSGVLQNVQIRSDQDWGIQEPHAEAELRIDYAHATRTLRLDRLRLQTQEGDILLAARGGMTLREGGEPHLHADWTFQPGTLARLDFDSQLIPRILNRTQDDMPMPHGILRAAITPEGTLDAPRLTLQAALESIRIRGAPESLPDTAHLQGQIHIDNRGADRPADAFLMQIPSFQLRLPGFASLAMQGRLQHLRAGDDGSLDLGSQTALSFRAQSNRMTPALLLGTELPSDPGANDSLLVEGQMLLPGAGAGDAPFWQRFLRKTELRNGRVSMDELIADARLYRDIRARLLMKDGILRMEDGHVHFGGPVHARFTADLNHALPRCELRFRTAGVPIEESVAHIGGYTRFLGGTIVAPHPNDGKEMVFQWEGVTQEDLDRTMRIPRTALVVQNFRLYAKQEATDWNVLMEQYVPQKFHEELRGDVERIREAEARMREALDQEIHYKTFYAEFEVLDQVLLIHDVRIEGGNTADFAVTGRIGFDESLQLDVMPIRHLDRTLHTDAILQNRDVQNVLRNIPAEPRNALVRIIPEWVEEIAQKRKIRMPVSGTTTNPVTHPDKLAEGILKELQKDLPKLVERAAGAFLKKEAVESLFGEEGQNIIRQIQEGTDGSIDLRNLF